MKNQFLSKAVPRGTRTIWRYLSALILLFSLSIGQMWGAEIFSWTVSSALAKNASEAATGGTVTCTGSGMGSEAPSSSGFFKFNSSTQLTFTLSSGTFAAGDVISFTFTTGSNGKTVGVEIQETSPVTQLTETIATKGTSATKTYTVTASDGIQGQNKFSIKRVDSNFSFKSVSVTRSGGGGDDPVDPTITFNDGAYTIGEALDLSDLFSSNSDGVVTYSIKTDGGTNASISGTTFSATAVGTATVTATQAAGTGYNAGSAEADIVVSLPDPCATHHWFVATADATANGKTNWDGFTNTVTGSNNQNNSVTIDGTTYNLTKRTGSTGGGGTILGFTIPANKAGTLYGYMKSSGSAARTLSLKKGDDVVKTNTEIVDGNWTLITIDAIAPGTYTLSPDQNVQVQMFVLKVCDATFHTITLDLNGGTGETSISALDGAPATKPADPTKEHFRFDGWFDVTGPYDWSAPVTGDLTLTAHWTQLYTVTYAAGDASATGNAPTQEDLAAGETFSVAANPFTVDGKDFVTWNDGSADYAPSATYTMGSANVTLTAQWAAASAKYTVHYMDADGTTPLGADELVNVGNHPVGVTATKPLNTFVAWQLSGSDIALDDASWASVAANAEVTLTARWAKAYAETIDLAAEAASSEPTAINDFFASKNYASTIGTGGGYDTNASGYLGYKFKNNGDKIQFNLMNGKIAEIAFMYIETSFTISVDGVEAEVVANKSTSATPLVKYVYADGADKLVELVNNSANGKTSVINKIVIRDPFTVTFDADGGDDVASLNGTPSVILPSATKGNDSFVGWFDGENKIGEAGESFTPTADITLKAHWETISTDARLASITLNPSTGVLSPAFDPEVVNYTYTMPYGTASVPQIVEATSVNANAQDPIIGDAAAAWGEAQTIQGVAQSGDKKTYTITMAKAPKDGVSIIKATINSTTKNTIGEVTGLYKKDASCGGLSSYKFNGKGAYIGLELVAGQTFNEGDIINIHTTTAAGQGTIALFDDHGNTVSSFHDYGVMGGAGDNKFALPASAEEKSIIYVCRTEANTWNGYVDFIEVTRAMNPVLTAIQFNSTDVAVTGTSVSATLPYGTNLASMTVTPTIVWNGAGTATVTGSWAWGANTFVVTDKDGDATTYTITLTEDELKYTVSFNTHGGSAVASKDVVAGGHLTADDVPADPEKEDYIFQHWSLTEDGAEVDITTVQVNAAVEFHAVWVADGGIKLLDGSTVNHTNFITGVTADETVEFQGNTVNYAKFSGTCSGVNSVKDLKRVIAYNATTNKTKIRISAHNNSTSARSILVKGLVEGANASVDLATIALGNKEDKVSDWIEFDNAANRTIYIMVSSSAGDVYFTQVKVIESGETPMKQAGEIGYSLNLNKGRAFGKADDDVAFEGLNIEMIGDYTALNSSYLKMNSSSISFAVAAPVTLNVTTANNKTYYVANSASGTDNETAFTGVSEFNLTAGTWFINAGDADVQFTNIAFSAPKCEKPAIVDMSDVDLCENDPYSALTVSASVSDGGTLHYAWFKEAGATDEPVGTDAASFTPEADGEYYVIVTNQLDGFADNTETSNAVTVQHLAGTTITTAPVSVRKDAGEAATLSVVAAGKNLSYEWFTCNADGTGAEPLEPAATETSLEVIVPDGEQYYKVVVTGDCGTVEAIAKVEKWVELTQQDVTETTFWDFSKNGVTGNTTIPVTEEEPVKLLANIPGVNNNELFRSDNIVAGSGKLTTGYVQTQKLSFHATVPGYITVTFSNTGNKENYRYLVVNGVQTSAGSKNGTAISYSCAVPAGDVELTVTEADGGKMFNFRSLKFEKVDYYRETRPGYYGTICLPNGGKMYDAALYEVAYFDGADKIFFDEVVDGTMEPGMPYIFLPEGDARALAVAYTDEDPAEAKSKNGLYGSYTQEELTPDAGNYVLLNNQYLFVNTTNVFVGANRAYIRLGEISTTATAPAPGRRRIVLDVHSEQTATGVENVNDASEQPQKLMINGKMFILRGEKLFDATGRLVK